MPWELGVGIEPGWLGSKIQHCLPNGQEEKAERRQDQEKNQNNEKELYQPPN